MEPLVTTQHGEIKMSTEAEKRINNAVKAIQENTAYRTIYEILGKSDLNIDSLTRIKLKEMAEEHYRRYESLLKK